MNTTDFKTWTMTRLEWQAMNMRRDMETIVRTCQQYADGNIWEPRHTEIARQLLQELDYPIGKYPGTVSDEDKQWYIHHRKPDWQWEKELALRNVRALESVKPRPAEPGE